MDVYSSMFICNGGVCCSRNFKFRLRGPTHLERDRFTEKYTHTHASTIYTNECMCQSRR